MAFFNFVPTSEREPNVYYTPLWATALFIVMYTLPVYLVLGISSSYLIDKLVAQKSYYSKWKQYLMEFFSNGLFGIVAVIIFLMILLIADCKTHLISDSLFNFIPFGLIASLLFYHVSLVIKIKGRYVS
jgi:hypothetical protein